MSSLNTFPWLDGFYKFPLSHRIDVINVTNDSGVVKFVMEHDMKIMLKSGSFEDTDNRGLDASGQSIYNVEISTTECGVPKSYAVIHNGGKTWTYSDGTIGEWMDAETIANIKEETDPADNYPCDYIQRPGNPGKLVWISGLTGTGKSTVSLHIKNRFGFILYEGDCFAAGFNPYVGAAPKAITPLGTRKLKGISEERNVVCKRAMEQGYAENKKGNPVPLYIWKDFYGLMCDDIIKERNRLGGNWIINQGVYTRVARDVVREKLGPELKMVVLTMSSRLQAQRVTKRAKIDLGGFGNVSEETLREMERQIENSGKGYETVKEDEENIFNLTITDDMSVEAVASKVLSFTN